MTETTKEINWVCGNCHKPIPKEMVKWIEQELAEQIFEEIDKQIFKETGKRIIRFKEIRNKWVLK